MRLGALGLAPQLPWPAFPTAFTDLRRRFRGLVLHPRPPRLVRWRSGTKPLQSLLEAKVAATE
eukprot:10658100-Alexandrium_andersonii.AAC.1